MIKKAESFVIILLISISTFYAGYYFGGRGFEFQIKKNPPKVTILNKEPKDQTIDFGTFWTVWDTLNKRHIDRPLDQQKLLTGAIQGMVAAVGDDYTSYFTPSQNELAKSSLDGVYEGIGAELGFNADKQLIIVSPLEGSPASASGILPGDKIVGIAGEKTIGISLSDAVSKIRGKANTQITLTIQRGEDEPKDITIMRGKIVTKSVTWKDLGNGIGYLRLSRFGDATTQEWTSAVSDMKTSMPNLKGVVLDVRGNPGGYLTAAVYISSEFMPIGKPVLYEDDNAGTVVPEPANRVGSLLDTPLVVLIDAGSASASEIVAGALHDSGRAQLVGAKSFGKGTVQTAEEYKDGSSLHVTIAKWLTPKKTWVHKVGITPDVVVERTEEDILAGRDPQLDKAKEVVSNEK